MLKRIKDGLTDLAPDVAEALGEGRAVVALEVDDHHAWNALPAECRDGARRSRRRCGRRALCRRQSRSSTGGSRSACRRDELEGLGAAKHVIKATRRDLAAAIVKTGERRHDGRRDDGDRGARRHRGFRDRRDRRRASRRGADVRHLRRPDRACREVRSLSSAPAASRSSISPRRWNFWRRRACRSSVTGRTSFPPSSRGRAVTKLITASTARPMSRP